MTITYNLTNSDGTKTSNKELNNKLDDLYKLIDQYKITAYSTFNIEIPKIKSITLSKNEALINTIYTNYKIDINKEFNIDIKDHINNNNKVDLDSIDLFTINGDNGAVYTLKNLIDFYNYLTTYNTTLTTNLAGSAIDIEINTSYHFYVIDILKYYYFSLILFCFLLILCNKTDKNIEIKNSEFYKSLNDIVTLYKENTLNDRPLDIIKVYENKISKISKSSNAFMKNLDLLKIDLNNISDNNKTLNSLYQIIIVIIILTLLVLLLSIYFRNNIKYICIGLLAIIIINIIFSTYVKIPYVEKFYSNGCDYSNINVIDTLSSSNPNINYKIDVLYKELCKIVCGLHYRYINNYVATLNYATNRLNNEKINYDNLKIKSKSNLLKNKDIINNDTLTFYQRREYTSLFIRLAILLTVLLILWNIFGDNVIIKIFGFVFFSLILMVYLYNIKIINRTDTNKRYWNHRYQY